MPSRADRPRIADVARVAGVSKTAVSFAFNSPDRLASGTATRIRAVAASLGYQPHPVARMLGQRRTMTLGVLTPQALSIAFSNPFFGLLGEGIAAAAEVEGYGLHLISPVRGSLALAIGRATVDGVVAIGVSGAHPEVAQLRSTGLPIVFVDADDAPESSSVVVDDRAGAEAAAEHLMGLGHREVLVVAVEPPGSDRLGPGETDGVTARRLGGYRAAFRAAGMELADHAVVAGRASIEGGAAAFHAAWQLGLRPTAVLAMSDAMAVGVMAAARDLGLEIPRDLSVVGFDDIDLAAHLQPALTTIHQPIRDKGAEAVRLLLAALDPAGQLPEHVRLETRLVVRDSTAPAPTRTQAASG